MNFFEQQSRARRSTALLVVYFVLAVVLIVVTVNAAVWGGMVAAQVPGAVREAPLVHPYWPAVTAAVLAVIAAGSLVSFVRLAGGGEAVAEMVGARRVAPGTTDPDERRLVNVVEEMSIASGTPVPALYVMDGEQAINAFVAGYSIDRTVLVVTRGALQALDRDELQGVVGHEYSHILNGDMRLNVRLMSTLAGILLLGQMGGFLLRMLRHGSSGRDRGSAVAWLLGAGLVLYLVGYVGLFFGRLIKAAVSRQREFLADASAVQFTRNPPGIAGALWKIGQAAEGSLLLNRHAEDMNHMCFGDAVKVGFQGLLATHPPIPVRIRAIDPSFSARRVAERVRAAAPPKAPAAASASPLPDGAAGFAGAATPVRTTPHAVVASVGNPNAGHVAWARDLHAGLPAALLEAAHGEAGARAVLCALVLQESAAAPTPGPGATPEALALLDAAADLGPPLRALPPAARLPLLEIALATLRATPEAGRRAFVRLLKTLAAADRRLTPFEMVLTVLAENELLPPEKGAGATVSRFEPVLGDVRTVLGALAHAGAAGSAAADTWRRIVPGFEGLEPDLPPAAACAPPRVAEALRRLAPLSPFLKQSLLNACADCVLADGRVAPPEAELLRAVAAALGCPMPPVLGSEA